jgi:hypothetical protein
MPQQQINHNQYASAIPGYGANNPFQSNFVQGFQQPVVGYNQFQTGYGGPQ